MKETENKPFESEITELEFKYSADDIKMSDFISFAEKLDPESHLEASSWDHYYSGDGLPFEFIRYRGGDSPELTIKIKKSDKNNNSRVEIDLPLRNKATAYLISKFVKFLGFEENFRIYKYCKIYWFEKIDIVYYVIYNKNMEEIGRRIEIEARKDYPFASEEEALAEVVAMEKKMAEIGLNHQRRMKKSNWEQFRVG